jgi:hypothetical protein
MDPKDREYEGVNKFKYFFLQSPVANTSFITSTSYSVVPKRNSSDTSCPKHRMAEKFFIAFFRITWSPNILHHLFSLTTWVLEYFS